MRGSRPLWGTIAALAVIAGPAHAAPPPTTEDSTITGDASAAYSGLTTGPGWARVVRTDLAPALAGREAARTSLGYFGQFSDMHITDEESPKRVELLDLDGTPFTSAWRPHEAFGPFISDQAVRQVNLFTDESPHAQGDGSRAAMDFALTTGDSADNMQRNEVEAVVTLLEGGRLDPNSGVDGTCGTPAGEGSRYTGVQDYDDYLETDGIYDPDEPAGRYAAWPRYPGLMDRAQKPFEAEGLDVPSYVTFGNHDGLAQGNGAEILPYDQIAVGCVKPFVALTLGQLRPSVLTTSPERVLAVPSDVKRAAVDDPQYRVLHATGAQADAHGFAFVDPAEAKASKGAANYYAWSPKPGLRFIALDTVSDGGVPGPSANGNLDAPQFAWLRREIAKATAAGELIVLFGHHPIRSLNAKVPDELSPPCLVGDAHGHDINPGCDRDPRSSRPLKLGADLQALALANPNVIAFVAGHTHEHKITAFKRQSGGGFWGIETASEIDWPIQSRLLEIMDNEDGTLSILGTVLDHGGGLATPPDGADAAGFDDVTLAVVGRELAFNDPQHGGGTGVGAPGDRNVELLLPDPR